MKLACMAIVFGMVFLPSAFGKVDFYLEDATIHSVATTDEKIIFIVSGKCHFALRKASEGYYDNADSFMDHGVIVVLRRGAPGAGYTSWDEHCKRAKSLEGTKAKIQTLEGQYVIERGQIIFHSCEVATF